MIHQTIPLANWGIGTFLIGVFALVCITLSVIVLRFVLGSKKKDSKENRATYTENENLPE